MKNPLCSVAVTNIAIAITATNKRDLSTAARCSTVRPHCLAAWNTRRPWQPLRLKLEYEGNNYQQDFAGKLEQKSKFNVGAIYRVTDWADVNLSYERGNTFYVWRHAAHQL